MEAKLMGKMMLMCLLLAVLIGKSEAGVRAVICYLPCAAKCKLGKKVKFALCITKCSLKCHHKHPSPSPPSPPSPPSFVEEPTNRNVYYCALGCAFDKCSKLSDCGKKEADTFLDECATECS